MFLSYQWDIKAKVKELKEKLELRRLTCWMGDEDELLPEDNMNEETEREISHCKVLKTFSKVSEGKKKL